MSSRSRPKGLPDTSNYRRISPEEANDQNNRLTNKHIRTLMLLDETLKENQELRRLLEMLHNEKCTCCRTDDSEQRVYAATQPLRSQVQSLTAELTAKNERLTAAERQLVEIQQTLEGQLAQSEKIHSEKVRATLAFDALSLEHAKCTQHLASEREALTRKFDEAKDNLLAQVESQKAECEKLLSERKQSEAEWHKRFERLEAETSGLKSQLEETAQADSQNRAKQSESTEKMRSQLAKQTETVTRLRDAETALQKRVSQLEAELDSTQAALLDARHALDNMAADWAKEKEVRSSPSSGVRFPPIPNPTASANERSFREFVQLRRQFQELCDENEKLRNRLKSHERTCGFLRFQTDSARG